MIQINRIITGLLHMVFLICDSFEKETSEVIL